MAEQALNFTGRDYTAELERLDALGLIEVPELTDLNHSDAGKALKRLTARSADMNDAYNDRAAQAGLVNHFIFKQDGIDIGRAVDYLPTLAAAASTRLRLIRVAGVTGAISIPKYSAFGRADGLTYLTVEAVTIADGSQSVEVNAIQGEVRTEDIEPADWIDDHDWSARPRYLLPKGLAAGTVEAWHGSPTVLYWTAVDSFWRSKSTDRHFLLELNGDTDEVWLVLGDGSSGGLPPSSENLHIRYVVCAEVKGNCGSSVIYLVPDELSGSVTCTNIEPATGGAAAESIASIRRMIPAMTATQRRAVTLEDYKARIEHLPGVLHCQALDRMSSPEWPHLHVVLYVVPEGGGPMSSLLKDQIWAECAERGHLGPWRQRYILKDAVEVPVNVSMRIGLTPGSTAESVTCALRAAIDEMFWPENQVIGGSISFTALHAKASAAAGVSWVEFDSIEDVRAGDGQILVAGVISVTVT